MQEAKYYHTEADKVRCLLCPQGCLLSLEQTGICRVRKNIRGKLFTLNYAECSACHIDPIEKKPLYHFYPGAKILSLGTWGCNFHCGYCQNWQISQEKPQVQNLSPLAAVELALNFSNQGNIGIAYTYSEPTVWYEYILATAPLAKMRGLCNVLVTNGYICQEPLVELLPYIDAVNIDVKGFSDNFYHTVCGGQLKAVMTTVELAAKTCHVEVTYLVIPGYNDDEQEIAAMARWLGSIRRDIPIHFTGYYPTYQFSTPPTTKTQLENCYRIASEYLDYVYLGNIATDKVNTYCPRCKVLLIDRVRGQSRLAPAGKCPDCAEKIRIIGEAFS